MDREHTYTDYYFKGVFGDRPLMSGCSLPNPERGPFEFVDCRFHPECKEWLEVFYTDSIYTNCDGGLK
jgi:hypothetical protein